MIGMGQMRQVDGWLFSDTLLITAVSLRRSDR